MSATRQAIRLVVVLTVLAGSLVYVSDVRADDTGSKVSEQSAKRFLQLAATPGWQREASRFAQDHPAVYLKLVNSESSKLPRVLAEIVASDLELVLGHRDAAKNLLRSAARRIATKPTEGWEDGVIPQNQYLVDVGEATQFPGYFPEGGEPTVLQASVVGSAHDNALLQRLLSLECWDEAGIEFRRVFELHKLQLAPYFTELDDARLWMLKVRSKSYGKWPTRRFHVVIHGFNRNQLFFARDYATYLNGRGRSREMLSLFEEVLTQVDLDREAGARDYLPSPSNEQAKLPRAGTGASIVLPAQYHAEVTGPEFVAFAFTISRTAGVEAELLTRLDAAVKSRKLSVLRVLAEWSRLAGDSPAAMRFEQRYIEDSGFDVASATFRRALLAQEAGDHRSAITLLQAAAVPNVSRNIPDIDAHVRTDPSSAVFWPVNYDYMPISGDPAAERKMFLAALNRAQSVSCHAVSDAQCKLEVERRSLEFNLDYPTVNFARVQSVRRAAAEVGSEAAQETDAWLNKQLLERQALEERASILYALGRQREGVDAAREFLAECALEKGRENECDRAYEEWREILKHEPSLLERFLAPGRNRGES